MIEINPKEFMHSQIKYKTNKTKIKTKTKQNRTKKINMVNN